MKKPWLKKEEQLLDEIKQTQLSEDETALWYLGQSGFVFKHGDQLIGIDLVLNDLTDAQGKTRRYYEIPFTPDRLALDVVLCTHGHRDHYDKKTIQGLYQANPEIRIVVPEGVVATLIEDGIPEENIVGMNDGDKENFDNLEVAAFSAAHPEILKDEQGKDLNLGYEMKIGPVQIAHLGDTLLCEELIDHLEKMENPDCMIVPINGQDYFRTARNCIGNLSPYEAVMAGKIAQAGQLIPCHYDMIMGNTCSVLDFVSNMEEHYPQGTFAIPRLGERLIFKKEK